ncbi:hypothetical protein RRG08_001820 [Elysia crispata]|uniref:Uncharacterized protein n=1 Tax=Elysia crispata TaxID=231223 RepID=A0AAE0Y6Y9_9GAST|nr:hypothetical protein RRG08_001820 [Elysia crispata]
MHCITSIAQKVTLLGGCCVLCMTQMSFPQTLIAAEVVHKLSRRPEKVLIETLKVSLKRFGVDQKTKWKPPSQARPKTRSPARKGVK